MAIIMRSEGMAPGFSGQEGSGKIRKSDEPTGAQGEEIVGLAARAFRAPLYATQGQPGTVLSEPAAHSRAFESGASQRLSGSAGYGDPNPRWKWRPSASCLVLARLAG